MLRRDTVDKVRDFEKTIEDAERLADCFNSFDDSDSWPGGFTHGNPYTAERVLERLNKSQDIRILVAFDGDKIVGHCNVCAAELDPEAVYVGLLGVDPAFQGKGYGKELLIEATETAARAGKRRIDLHTWGGNLKAMPLYKRVGYNWVPKTRVLMESHIPGIINASIFSAFFERYHWYDSLKREIKQEMDDITEDSLGVYNYYFEGENDDRLEVIIDREVKGICGFSMTLDGSTLSALVKPKSHTGYIGIGKTPATIEIQNGTTDEVSCSVRLAKSHSLDVEINGPTNGMISSGGEFHIDSSYSMPYGVLHIDRAKNPDEKVHSCAEWELNIGGQEIKLFSGLIPTEPITLTTIPRFPTLSIGETKKIGIGLRNNIDRELKIRTVITSDNDAHLSNVPKIESLQPEEGIDLYFTTSLSELPQSNVLGLQVSVYDASLPEEKLISRSSFDIPVIAPTTAVAYRTIDDNYVLETPGLRAFMRGQPPMVFRFIENKILNSKVDGWFLLPEIGYPFPSGGSEWQRAKFNVSITNNGTHGEISLSAESTERPGLFIIHHYIVHANQEYIEVTTELRNSSGTTYKNLGIRAGGWFDIWANRMYVPVRGDVIRLASLDWFGDRQIPTKPKDLTESWAAVTRHGTNALYGYIWDVDNLREVRLTRQWSVARPEYALPDIEPGQCVTKNLINIMVGQGSWKKVRHLWGILTGKSIVESKTPRVKSDLDVQFITEDFPSSRNVGSPVFIEKNGATDVMLNIGVIHETPIEAEVIIHAPNGVSINGEKKIEFNVSNLSIDTPFSKSISFSVDAGDEWLRKNGKIALIFKNRIVRYDLPVIVYNSSAESSNKQTLHEGIALYETKSGNHTISVSPEHGASLVHFKPFGKESYFRDTFPDAGPFVWWDSFFSGMNPLIIGEGVWDWETGLNSEKWDIKEIDSGPWHGYEMTSKLKHSPNLKGITIRIQHLLLSGTPLIYSRIEAHNTSGQYSKMKLGFRGVPQLGGEKQPIIHIIVDRRKVRYEPTSNEVDIHATADEGWVSLEPHNSEDILGVISNTKSRETLLVSNLGDAGEYVSVRDDRELNNDEKTSVSCYFLALDSPDDIELLKYLPSTTGQKDSEK